MPAHAINQAKVVQTLSSSTLSSSHSPLCLPGSSPTQIHTKHTRTHTHSQLKRHVTDRLILPLSLSRSILTQDLSSSLLLSPMIKTHRRVVGVEEVFFQHLKMTMNELTTKIALPSPNITVFE